MNDMFIFTLLMSEGEMWSSTPTLGWTWLMLVSNSPPRGWSPEKFPLFTPSLSAIEPKDGCKKIKYHLLLKPRWSVYKLWRASALIVFSVDKEWKNTLCLCEGMKLQKKKLFQLLISFSGEQIVVWPFTIFSIFTICSSESLKITWRQWRRTEQEEPNNTV